MQKQTLQKYKKLFTSPMVIKRIGTYYVFRIARIGASSNSIALGFAVGVAVSFSPLVGLHFLTTICCCYILRGNIVAGMTGSLVGNPWTWPMIWLVSYKVSVFFGVGGHAMSSHEIHNLSKDFGHAVKHLEFKKLWYDIWPIFYKILIGTIPTGIVAGLIVYFPVKYLVNKIRITKFPRRKKKLDQEQG